MTGSAQYVKSSSTLQNVALIRIRPFNQEQRYMSFRDKSSFP